MDSDAQRDVLSMVAEKVINIDEAERLLKALNEGEQRNRHRHSRRKKSYHQFRDRQKGMFESMHDVFSNIGPVVSNTIKDAMNGVFDDAGKDLPDEDFVDVDPLTKKFDIDSGTSMIVINDWKVGSKHGNLNIQGIAGNTCSLDDTEAQLRRIRRSASCFAIYWTGMQLNIDVPETVSRLLIHSKGGNIQAVNIHSEMSAKTLGGNIALTDLMKDFQAKTMGGDIGLTLNPDWSGDAHANTMGGNIVLQVPDGVGFAADAFTMGGTISAPKHMKVENKKSFPGKKVAIHAGDIGSTSTIGLKTMGGNIMLRDDTDEG